MNAKVIFLLRRVKNSLKSTSKWTKSEIKWLTANGSLSYEDDKTELEIGIDNQVVSYWFRFVQILNSVAFWLVNACNIK